VTFIAGRDVSEAGQRFLDQMPPFYREDPFTVAVQNALGNEFQRINDVALAVRVGAFPQNATDDYGLLGLWESTFGLAVSPPGSTLAQRQSVVLAHFRKRHSGAGTDWVAALDAIVGVGQWTYTEDSGVYRVTVHIPFSFGSYGAAAIEALAREITPAHIDIAVLYSEGFLIGVGLIGLDRL
jgi:hypothetical protein